MLLDYIKADPKASKITDLAIVTFGGEVQVQSSFDDVKNISFKPLRAYSSTPMGSAVNVALDMINHRKAYYLENGIEFYRPRIFLMSDGAATDAYSVIEQGKNVPTDIMHLSFQGQEPFQIFSVIKKTFWLKYVTI